MALAATEYLLLSNRTKQVLDTIEPFLLDIANMRDQPSREEVRSLRERVKKTEIIASLQVY